MSFTKTEFIEKIAGTYLLYYDAVNKEQKMCLAKPINVLNDHLEMPKLDLPRSDAFVMLRNKYIVFVITLRSAAIDNCWK